MADSRAHTPRFCTSAFSLQPPWCRQNSPCRTGVSDRASLNKSKAYLAPRLKAEGRCAALMHIYRYASYECKNHPFHRSFAPYIHTLCIRTTFRLKAEGRCAKLRCIRARAWEGRLSSLPQSRAKSWSRESLSQSMVHSRSMLAAGFLYYHKVRAMASPCLWQAGKPALPEGHSLHSSYSMPRNCERASWASRSASSWAVRAV